MSERRAQRALISVFDKTGVIDLACALHGELGIEIISTGGTAALLAESGVPVRMVEDVTGVRELLDGRVKTLHPAIHAAILADRDNPEHMRQLAEQGIAPIDIVVANLYPFEKTVANADCTFEQAIEMIDIGGPCLLRAAAKNHRHVLVVSSPDQYDHVRKVLRGDPAAAHGSLRQTLAARAFEVTRRYDLIVRDYLDRSSLGVKPAPGADELPVLYPQIVWDLDKESPLRYGENAHQSAALYRSESMKRGLSSVPGKMAREAASFNNYLDADAALKLCADLTRALPKLVSGAGYACAFIKHTNPCGVGIAADPVEAYRRAYLGDPNAAMGGILACSFEVTAAFAAIVMDTFDRWGKAAGAGGFFVEVWLAPHFEKSALKVIETQKPWGERVRLLADRDLAVPSSDAQHEYRRIKGGVLVQTPDTVGLNEEQWSPVSTRRPTDAEMNDLRLAWLICKHTRSNAISICKDGMLIGNGAGQMSRVMSCRVATWSAKENGHEAALSGAAAASDAFFPFADGPEILMDAGVTAIIQPGGSKRDGEVLMACNHCDAAVIFTNTRHFRH